MTDKPIELDLDGLDLNIEGIRNVPICPLCTAELEQAPSSHRYTRYNPDTRWFWCSRCEAHLGYHRMKAKWLVDPHDLAQSNRVREHFGLLPVEQQ